MAKKAEAELKVELVNVGHGDALVLHWRPRAGEPSTILIDGGPSAGAAAVETTLGSLGVAEIDLAILTHCDSDHVDGLLGYFDQAGAVPVRRYWGPCIPAFRRHQWLFSPRVFAGIDKAERLEKALPKTCNISWPVEGATWTSSDGDLSIKVVSPAPRLIERLLVGNDSIGLFLEQPMPAGWLLADVEDDEDDDGLLSGLRLAMAAGELTPDSLPRLPPVIAPLSEATMMREAATKGVEPEFFGNSVLNDTSIVLLVEARIGVVTRRLLLTGDLENFTYLMARYPMGLGCDIVKAPHHGSRSYVDREIAYDAVWQWMRPKAVLVSANGKHSLPRSDFRDAALRYGTTLFCTSRRRREIVSGEMTDPCCHSRYGCRSEASVVLSVTAKGIEADQAACARGSLTGVMPIIEVRQHVVEPSPILSTMAETEMRKHTDWAVSWLRDVLKDRQQYPSHADLAPVSLKVMTQAAIGSGRVGASVEMETILERAARAGKVWMPRRRYRDDERNVWIMPQAKEIADFKAWIDRLAVVQLAIKDRPTVSAPEELLYVADTGWIADRFSEDFAYPKPMFATAIWPVLTAHLLKTRVLSMRSVPSSTYPRYDASTIMILFSEPDVDAAFTALAQRLDALSDQKELRDYVDRIVWRLSSGGPMPDLGHGLSQIVTPLWLERSLLPGGLVDIRNNRNFPVVGDFTNIEIVRRWIASLHGYEIEPLPDHLLSQAVASITLSGYDEIRLKPKWNR